MKKRKLGEVIFCFVVMLAMSGIFSSNAAAEMNSSFHGYFESSFYLRDADGIQYGFFDEAYGVQQRNTLKFDIDIKPDISYGPFAVEKVHLTYRGAYDSIFDLRAHAFDIKENIGATRFDYGLKDIRFENDLREAFIDFTYKGGFGDAFFRPGRQIVSWGEGFLETLNDVINPPDQSYQLFFQNPDDVKIPLWMGRLNYNMPSIIEALSLNFDFLWIPDIRPQQLGVRDSVAGNPLAGMEAPYSFLFTSLRGFSVREDVPTSENEYGAKVTAEIGRRLSFSALYFRDVVNDPGIKMDSFRTGRTAWFTHNKQHVYGAYFSYQVVPPLDFIVRGEVSRHTAYPIKTDRPIFDGNWLNTGNPAIGIGGRVPLDNSAALINYVYKPVTKTMLAIDKNLRWRWISPHDLTSLSFEWLHKEINEWDSAYSNPTSTKDRVNVREVDVFFGKLSTYWWSSKLAPAFAVACNPGKHGEGATWMIKPEIKWQITPELYSNLNLQAFFGDKKASYSFADLIGVSEASIKIGYEW